MASVYVAEVTVTGRLGSRATALLDRDGDGTADSGLLAGIIESQGRWIDMHLAQRVEVPFAQITGTPATPGAIQEIALDLVLADLYRWKWPDGVDAKDHRDRALSALKSLLDGDFDFSGGDRVDAVSGRHIVSATYEDPIVSGTDSAGVDRLRGV